MTNFLGIDPALSNTAYVLIDEDYKVIIEKVITTYSFPSNVYVNSEQRILDIFKHFKIVPLIENLESVYIEDIGYMSKDRYLFERVGLIFMIRCYLFEHDIKTVIVPPKSLKKKITNNGNADKQQMIQSISDQFGILWGSDHLADAYGLAIMAAWEYQGK